MGIGEYGVAAVRPAGQRGKLDPSAVRWRFKKNLPYIPSPLVYQDLFYMVKDGGIVTTLDAATGQTLKEGRATGAAGKYVASPVAADGKVFLASVDGKVTVLKAGAQWEVLGVNDLGDEIHATPALSGGRLYVRTRGTLYCFGAAKG
jgi:outer membrane protein assembly factor BamB